LAGVRTGDPVTIAVPSGADAITVAHPDGERETIPAAGAATVAYARTHDVGIYRVDPSLPGQDVFTVNLFNADEGDVAPTNSFSVGGSRIAARQGQVLVNEPVWHYFVLGLLVLSLVEWTVYNKRVYV
jgi:hypothetical protein